MGYAGNDTASEKLCKQLCPESGAGYARMGRKMLFGSFLATNNFFRLGVSAYAFAGRKLLVPQKILRKAVAHTPRPQLLFAAQKAMKSRDARGDFPEDFSSRSGFMTFFDFV
jgi:hypothetical protein